ncbi:hypothetical protein [Chondromyces crocatus]|uniref:Secreted protein n=1 Tax=Chondromyces crocatus TaxID=52 RepID=A0A0K1EKW1_CHOCO|nr:hypothetical protein [Chondromyces crocatus]AKT41292.1 uncharacterized protein CMC5_054590 [Chondromyces crocatus]
MSAPSLPSSRRRLSGAGALASGFAAASTRALLATTLLGASPAVAQETASSPLARLTVTRTAEATDCPDAAALTAAVEVAMKRPALDDASEEAAADTYEVRIFREDDAYAAVLRAGDLTRRISDPGPTCAGLAEALAITLAILLDSEAPPRAEPAPPSPAPPSPATPSARSTRRAPGSTPTATPTPAPSARAWDVSLDLGVSQTLGVLTPFSWAFHAEASLRLERVSFGAGAIWMPTRTLDVTPGQVDITLALATARACAAIAGHLEGPRLSVCAQPMVGAFSGAGRGYDPDRQVTVPWAALGALLLGEGPIAGPLGWSLRGAVVAPLVSEELTIDRVDGPAGAQALSVISAFTPSPIGFSLGAGLRVSIP